MKINILRKLEYEKHWIHIMQFQNVFQYLFADKKGNIYQQYITIPYNKLHFIKYKLGFKERPLSDEDMEIGEKVMISGAMTSIDALLDKQHEEVKNFEKVAEEINAGGNKECNWMATEIDDAMKWQCLNHGVILEMTDGVLPHHEVGILSPIQFAK